MCWFIKIEIIPKEGLKIFKADFLKSLNPKISFNGNFPRYSIHDGHCLCDYLIDQSNWGIITPMIETISKNEQVKRVKVIKYWSEIPQKTVEHKLSQIEFNELDGKADLLDNTWYNIIDTNKFNH